MASQKQQPRRWLSLGAFTRPTQPLPSSPPAPIPSAQQPITRPQVFPFRSPAPQPTLPQETVSITTPKPAGAPNAASAPPPRSQAPPAKAPVFPAKPSPPTAPAPRSPAASPGLSFPAAAPGSHSPAAAPTPVTKPPSPSHSPPPSAFVSSPETITTFSKTPPQSPQTKPISHPPSPLTSPPAQTKTARYEQPEKHTEVEQITVLMHEITPGKPKIFQKISPDYNHETTNKTINPYEKGKAVRNQLDSSIVTLAGENKGATMQMQSRPNTTFINSNVQGINNSILYNSSFAHNDPGVRLKFSRKFNVGH